MCLLLPLIPATASPLTAGCRSVYRWAIRSRGMSVSCRQGGPCRSLSIMLCYRYPGAGITALAPLIDQLTGENRGITQDLRRTLP